MKYCAWFSQNKITTSCYMGQKFKPEKFLTHYGVGLGVPIIVQLKSSEVRPMNDCFSAI